MTKRKIAALALPFAASVFSALYFVEGWDVGSVIARFVVFGVMFGFVVIYWRRNKHRVGTWRNTRDLLPRFKGTEK